MSLYEFFPESPTLGVSVTEHGIMRHLQVWCCQRCHALTPDRLSHYCWHQAVDTGATTTLPTDSKHWTTAGFPSRCPSCDGGIRVDDRIGLVDGEWLCSGCAE